MRSDLVVDFLIRWGTRAKWSSYEMEWSPNFKRLRCKRAAAGDPSCGRDKREKTLTLSRQTVKIVVAIIVLVGGVTTAALNSDLVFRYLDPSPDPPPLPVPAKPEAPRTEQAPTLKEPTFVTRPQLERPVRWTELPTIQIVADDDAPFGSDPLVVRFGKANRVSGTYGDYPELENKWFTVDLKKEARHLTATIDTAPLIREKFPDTPHGVYRLIFRVCDKLMLCDEKTVVFSYVYYTTFPRYQLTTELGSDNSWYERGPGSGGLLIRNPTSREGYVPLGIRQLFGFRENLRVRGEFTPNTRYEYGNHAEKPVGLEIAICNPSGSDEGPYKKPPSILSAVVPDGAENKYSIKVGNDEYGSPVTRRVTDIEQHILTDGSRTYRFELRINAVDEKLSCCQLYVAELQAQWPPEEPVHTRCFNTSLLGQGPIVIELRAWKKGQILLHNLEVAESSD